MQIYARFTPNPDQLRNNLRAEKNLDFFGLVNSRSTLIVRSQASVYIDVGERLTYESTKKYIIGKVIRVTCEYTMTDLRALDRREPLVSLSA